MENDEDKMSEESKRAIQYSLQDEDDTQRALEKRNRDRQKEGRRKAGEERKIQEKQQKEAGIAKAAEEKKKQRKQEQRENAQIMEEQRKKKQTLKNKKTPEASKGVANTPYSNMKQNKNPSQQANKEEETQWEDLEESPRKHNEDLEPSPQNKRRVYSQPDTNKKTPQLTPTTPRTQLEQPNGYSANDITSAMRSGTMLPNNQNKLGSEAKSKIAGDIEKNIQDKLKNTTATRANTNGSTISSHVSEGNNQAKQDEETNSRDMVTEKEGDNDRFHTYGRNANSEDPYNNRYGMPRSTQNKQYGQGTSLGKTGGENTYQNHQQEQRSQQYNNTNWTTGTRSQKNRVEQNDVPEGRTASRRPENLPRRMGEMAGKTGKAVKGVAKKIGLTMAGPVLVWIVIVVVILLLLVGAAGFIMNMPGMVIDKLSEFGDSIWASVKGVFEGQDVAKITDKQILDLAKYLDKMGFKVDYYGLATGVERDKSGNLVKINDSKYLLAYLAAEERNYMIANENWNVKQWWKGLLEYENWSKEANWGTGMIVLHEDLVRSPVLKDQVQVDSYIKEGGYNNGVSYMDGFPAISPNTTKQVLQRIRVYRQTKEMVISREDINTQTFNSNGYDLYRYKLNYWIDKYGTPLDFYLALHVATRAPEFVYNMATRYDTKVFVSIHEIKDVEVSIVYAEGSENGKIILDEEGKPKMTAIKDLSASQLEDLKKKWDLSDTVIEKAKSFNRENLITFTPYITSVENHWYYKQVLYKGTIEEGENAGKKVNVYEERTLNPGDPGYVRFYAYTEIQKKPSENGAGGNNGATSNEKPQGNDVGDISSETESPSQKPGGGLFGGLFGKMLDVMISGIFYGDFSGITGLLETATQAMIEEGYKMLRDEIVDIIPDGILKNLAENCLNGLDSFVKNGLTDIDLSDGIKLGDLDFGKITDSISLERLTEIRIDDVLEIADLGDVSKYLDMANITNINDLVNLTDKIDFSNLQQALNDINLAKVVDLDKLNIDSLTEKMYSGIAGNLEDLQNNIMDSYQYAFNNLTDTKAYEEIIGNLTQNVSDGVTQLMSGDFMNRLEQEIQGNLNGILNADLNTLLSNEFAKQMTGLNIDSLTKLANNNLDFNTITKIGTQLTDTQSAISALTSQANQVANMANQVSVALTGVDASVLNVLNSQLTGLYTAGNSLYTQTQNIEKNLSHLDQAVATEVKQNIDGLNTTLNTMNQNISKLDVVSIENYSNEVKKYQDNLNHIAQNHDLDNNTVNEITKFNQLADEVVKKSENLDTVTTQNVVKKLGEGNLTKLTQVSDSLTGIHPNTNLLNTTVDKMNGDITKLKVNDLPSSLDSLKNTYSKMNELAKEIPDLDRDLKAALEGKLRSVNSAIDNIANKIGFMDMSTLTQLTNQIENLDSNKLLHMANQLSGLENSTFGQLLGQLNHIPGNITEKLGATLTDQIAKSVTDNIAKNLSGKLTGNLLNSFDQNNLAGSLVGGGGDGPKEVGSIDREIEDTQNEYLTGFFVREIRKKDVFQTAEPVLIPYSEKHWNQIFNVDKYIIVDDKGIDLSKIEDKDYIKEHGRTIWASSGLQLETAVLGVLQSLQTTEAEYAIRFFRELFIEFPNVFKNKTETQQQQQNKLPNKETIGWIFKTEEVEEVINNDTGEKQTVKKGEYEPVTWSTSEVGMLYSKKNNSVNGFAMDLDVVSPANAVVIKKTDRQKNELEEITPASITLELKNTGDANADGIRIIITGANFTVSEGSTVSKGQVIGKTTQDNIKVMALKQGSHTQAVNISEYIYPPYITRLQQQEQTNQAKGAK